MGWDETHGWTCAATPRRTCGRSPTSRKPPNACASLPDPNSGKSYSRIIERHKPLTAMSLSGYKNNRLTPDVAA